MTPQFTPILWAKLPKSRKNGNLNFVILGHGRPLAGGPRMDRRLGVVNVSRLASRLRRSARRESNFSIYRRGGHFLDAQASLAPTQVSLSVRPSVTLSDFQSVSVSGRPT